MTPRKDRRVARTRKALINAVDELVLAGRKGAIRVSDIVERANVGRSTFYEHYSSAADIYMQALSRPLAILADAMCGRRGPEELETLLRHFRENRQRARTTFSGREGEQVARLLAGMLEERLCEGGERPGEPAVPVRLAALQLAEGTLGLLRGWVSGEASCTPERLARAICATSALTIAGAGLVSPEPEGR